MAKKLYKYMDVDVFAFLEEKMKGNTEFFQSDFEMDKSMMRRFAESPDKEDKTLFWMSRPCGTHTQRERESFIRDTYDHNTWKFYAEQTLDKIVAFTVELTGVQDGVVRGNLYELNYPLHAEMVATKAVPALEVEKTFADGLVERMPPKKMSLGYLLALSEEHGGVVKSRTISEDEERLSEVLAE